MRKLTAFLACLFMLPLLHSPAIQSDVPTLQALGYTQNFDVCSLDPLLCVQCVIPHPLSTPPPDSLPHLWRNNF